MNIRLRQVEAKDCQLIRQMMADPTLSEFWRRYPPGFTWLSEATVHNTLAGHYLIEEMEGEKVRGIINLGNPDPSTRSAEFGIAITGEQRSKVATAAIIELFEYVFTYLNLNKVFARVLSHREDIKKLLTSWNFKLDGCLRQNCLVKGELKDELIYSLTQQEFVEVMNGRQPHAKLG